MGLGEADVEQEVVGDAGAALDLELADVDLGVGDQGVVDLDQDALVVLGLGAAGGDVGGLDHGAGAGTSPWPTTLMSSTAITTSWLLS
jgi:hypothetical protein